MVVARPVTSMVATGQYSQCRKMTIPLLRNQMMHNGNHLYKTTCDVIIAPNVFGSIASKNNFLLNLKSIFKNFNCDNFNLKILTSANFLNDFSYKSNINTSFSPFALIKRAKTYRPSSAMLFSTSDDASFSLVKPISGNLKYFKIYFN